MSRIDCTGKNIDELLAGDFKEAVAAIKADPSVEAAISKYKAENEEYGFLVDDVFVLRYATTYPGDIPAASRNLVRTLEWRRDNHDLLRPFHIWVDPATGKEAPRDPTYLTRVPGAFRELCQHLPGFKEFALHDANTYHGATVDMAPVFYLRTGVSNTKACEGSTSFKNIHNIFVLTKEAAFCACDHITRTRRTFVHTMGVIDCKGMGMSSIPSREFRKMQNESSADVEIFYPQLLGRVVLVNIPIMLKALIHGMLMVMPKSLTEKTIIASPPDPKRVAAARERSTPKNADGSVAESTLTLADTFYGIPFSSLPSFLGGSCRCGKPRIDFETGSPLFDGTALDKHGLPPGWCIDGIPNNQKDRLHNWKKHKEANTHTK